MFTAKVANYFGIGNETTEFSDGSWSWNVLSIKVSKYRIRVIQRTDIIANKVKAEGMIYTSDIEISGVSRYEEGERIVNDLCRILSLASFSQVVPFNYSYAGCSRTMNISADSMYFRPLIQIKDGEETQQYIEKIWAKYRVTKKSRKLAEIIDMLTIAELPVQPLEVKLAQIFVVLENLKSTYAKSQKIPFHKGFYRKVSLQPKKLNSEPKYSFKELLAKMFSDVGMNPSLKRILNLRNEIIHFGLSRKPYHSLRKDYDFCHDIVREYLLRFLEYDGYYMVYSSAARSIQKIESA